MLNFNTLASPCPHHRQPQLVTDRHRSRVQLVPLQLPPELSLVCLGHARLMPLDQVIVRSHNVLRFVWIRSVHTASIINIPVVAWRLVELSLRLVSQESVQSWLSNVMGEVVVSGSMFLDQLHILQLDGMVVLPGHLVIHLVRIIWYVPLFFDLHGDSSIKPPLVVGLAEDMLLAINQLLCRLSPSFLILTSTRSDPSSPVQSLEPGNHSGKVLSFTIMQVVQFHPMSILEHLMAGVEWILPVNAWLGILSQMVFSTSGCHFSIRKLMELLQLRSCQGRQKLQEGGG